MICIFIVSLLCPKDFLYTIFFGYNTFVVPFKSDDLCSLLDTRKALVFLVGSTLGFVKEGQ
jgi:hypothetical protein